MRRIGLSFFAACGALFLAAGSAPAKPFVSTPLLHRPLAELEATTSLPWLRQWYVWGAGGVGGLVMISDSTSSGWSWYTLSDGRGNLAGMGDYLTGETGGWLDYSPFGEVLRAAGVAAYLPLRHSSKYEDAETGFVYYNRRYYDPVTGRWLSRDPIGEAGGLNVYAAFANDPVNVFDPDGEKNFYYIAQPDNSLSIQNAPTNVRLSRTVAAFIPALRAPGSPAQPTPVPVYEPGFAVEMRGTDPFASLFSTPLNFQADPNAVPYDPLDEWWDNHPEDQKERLRFLALVASFAVPGGEGLLCGAKATSLRALAAAERTAFVEFRVGCTAKGAGAVHLGAAAAASSELSQASILRALRANGSPEALATSKLISRGRVNLNVVPTDPLGQGAAGRYFFGTRDIAIARDVAGTPSTAAGFASHETRHFLQGIDASTYRRIHEFDAYSWQRAADSSLNNWSDAAIWQHIRTHPLYQYVPE